MNRIKVRRYRIKVPERAGRPSSPIRIVVIGDLHNRKFGDGNSILVNKITAEHPDLILSVGDLMKCKNGKMPGYEVGLRLLKRLACDCPIYCVNGNHEYRAKISPLTYGGVYSDWKRNLDISQIHYLEDTTEELELKGVRFAVSGLELQMRYYKKFSKAAVSAEEIRDHIGQPKEDTYQILLAHNPLYFDGYASWGADLTCSGHFHGGLVRLPLIGGLISPQFGLFPKYDVGLFDKCRRKMLVTAGLGSHSIAIRVNNPAEFSVVELY